MVTDFTPLEGLLGGALIGIAAAWLLLADGKIAGVSGIVARVLEGAGRGGARAAGELGWRVAFLCGLPLGAALVLRWTGDVHGFAITASWPVLITGGLLVGYGTALGNGCTSGHGVCGISRGSRRSIVATGVFMATGIATVFVVRHVFGGA
jgi:hypothetical protein